MNNDKTATRMEHHDTITKVLDGAGVTTFLAGIITGTDILTILGCMASVAAILNHLDQYLRRKKHERK